MVHRFDVSARRRVGVLAACMALGLAGSGILAGLTRGTTASAASYSGCWGTGPTVTDFGGDRWHTKYCHNYLGGEVSWDPIGAGFLYAGNNWFVCQARFTGWPNPAVGSARNNIWLYTQADRGVQWYQPGYKYHKWGYFPATYVSGGVNYGPIPGLPWCTF